MYTINIYCTVYYMTIVRLIMCKMISYTDSIIILKHHGVMNTFYNCLQSCVYLWDIIAWRTSFPYCRNDNACITQLAVQFYWHLSILTIKLLLGLSPLNQSWLLKHFMECLSCTNILLQATLLVPFFITVKVNRRFLMLQRWD